MPNTIDLDLVRQGDQHLQRAKQLNPRVTARAVPVATITTGALTVPELAQLAGVHPQTIRRAIHAGELRAATGFQGKGHARISRTDAEVWWRGRGGGTLLGDLTPLESAPSPSGTTTISREEAKAKGYGFLKGRIRSSDDFLADKHAEAERERQRDDARRAQSKQVAA
jgi:excisionase family DNA binding protein